MTDVKYPDDFDARLLEILSWKEVGYGMYGFLPEPKREERITKAKALDIEAKRIAAIKQLFEPIISTSCSMFKEWDIGTQEGTVEQVQYPPEGAQFGMKLSIGNPSIPNEDMGLNKGPTDESDWPDPSILLSSRRIDDIETRTIHVEKAWHEFETRIHRIEKRLEVLELASEEWKELNERVSQLVVRIDSERQAIEKLWYELEARIHAIEDERSNIEGRLDRLEVMWREVPELKELTLAFKRILGKNDL